MIPTVSECFQLMDEFHMLENIRDHSIVVARIAELLAIGVAARGVSVSLEKTVAGALLHDIGKTSCLDNDCDHARMGMEICLSRNLVEIAPIVAEHVILRDPENNHVTEKEIVYYADKRVRHDEIVSLDERLVYILERYGRDSERIHQAIINNFSRSHRLEEKLFALLDFVPADLAGRIDRGRFAA